MQLTGNTILITGGSSGIGMALAERFLACQNEVIICGRNEAALKAMQARNPSVHYMVCDTGNPSNREALAQEVVMRFPRLNMLVNNAGIQRKIDLLDREPWQTTWAEVEINLGGPIHLSMLLAPYLVRQEKSYIANVGSGLAFAPLAHLPVYCATKAALHSFTQSLRYQLRATCVEVMEIIPPAVRTNLGGAHDYGADLHEFTDSIMEQLEAGAVEASFGIAQTRSRASREELDRLFLQMNESAGQQRS